MERLHAKLGRLATGRGHFAQALEELAESFVYAERMGDNARQGESIAQIGWAHAFQGTAAEGLARLELWLSSAKLAALTPQVQSAVFCARAALFFILNRYGDQLESANRALDLAEAARDISAAASANRQRGLALVMLGQLVEAQSALAKTEAQAKQVGDLQTYAAALNDLSDVFRMRGDLHAFQGYIARAVAAAERLGDLAITAFATANHGDAAYLLGDWITARLRYERAMRIARDLGDSWATAYPLLALGRLDLAQGNIAEALGLLYEAQSLAQQSDDQQALRNIQPILAEHDLLRGAAEKALADLRHVLSAASLNGNSGETVAADEKDIIAALPVLAWAQLATGAEADAVATLDRCQTQAEAMGAQSIVLDALLVRALLRILRKRVDDLAGADNILRSVLRMAREMSNPYARAKALYLYGLLDITRNRRAAARKRLKAAHAFCVRLGERLYRHNIAHALRRLANGGHATPRVAVISTQQSAAR
jgi:ATP/maltotriose-dependent transcriptional regulator MalT